MLTCIQMDSRMASYNPSLCSSPSPPPTLEVIYITMSAEKIGTGLMETTTQPDKDTQRSPRSGKQRGLGGTGRVGWANASSHKVNKLWT